MEPTPDYTARMDVFEQRLTYELAAVRAEFAAIRREIEFGNKTSAQAIALMAPVLEVLKDGQQGLKDELHDVEKGIADDEKTRQNRLQNSLYTVVATIVIALLLAGLKFYGK